jgi:hypothetical protein
LHADTCNIFSFFFDFPCGREGLSARYFWVLNKQVHTAVSAKKLAENNIEANNIGCTKTLLFHK